MLPPYKLDRIELEFYRIPKKHDVLEALDYMRSRSKSYKLSIRPNCFYLLELSNGVPFCETAYTRVQEFGNERVSVRPDYDDNGEQDNWNDLLPLTSALGTEIYQFVLEQVQFRMAMNDESGTTYSSDEIYDNPYMWG